MKKGLVAGFSTCVLMFGGIALALNESTFDSSTEILHIPTVRVYSDHNTSDDYNVYMQGSPEIKSSVTSGTLTAQNCPTYPNATYTISTGILSITNIYISGRVYSYQMKQNQGLDFSYKSKGTATSSSYSQSTFDDTTGITHIPEVRIQSDHNTSDYYEVYMQGSPDLTSSVISATPIALNCQDSPSATYTPSTGILSIVEVISSFISSNGNHSESHNNYQMKQDQGFDFSFKSKRNLDRSVEGC